MSLRARILLLVLAVTLVPALMQVHMGLRDRESDIDEAAGKIHAVAHAIAVELEEAISATVQLQYGLSRARELYAGDRRACSDFLAAVLKDYAQYTSILTILPGGELFCDSLRTGQTLNLADRRYFQDTLGSAAPVAIEPSFGRFTGKSVLHVAYAAREAGATRFVLLASLDLERFMQRRFPDLPFKTATLALVDAKGTVLTWHPGAAGGLAGTSLAESPLHRLARGNGGTGETIEHGGVKRLWAAASPGAFPQAGVAVLLGISAGEATAAADHRLRDTLWVVTGAALLAFALAWILADAGLRRPVARIHDAVTRFQAGDLTARIGPPYARGELGELMRSLDLTAERLAGMNSELREQFESFMQNLPVMASIRDADGRILYANDAWADINGIAPEEAMGRTNTELFGADFAAVVEAQDAEVRASGRPGQFRFTRRTGDVERQYETFKFPLRQRDGHPNLIGALTFDVTERERAAAALVASENRYRSLAENLSVLVYRADPVTLQATFVNRAVKELYGYDVAEWLAQPSMWERIVHPEDRGRVLVEFQEALQWRGAGRVEYRVVRRDGEVRWVVDSFAYARDASGAPVALDGVVHDVTERRLMFERLAASDRAKTAFLAATSHELKTPLNAILGFSDLLRDESDPAVARAHAGEIRAAGRRLLALLNDVLDFARLEEGGEALRREQADIGLLLSEAAAAQRADADRRGIAVALEVGAAGSAVVDPRRLKQLVAHLLSNALKFSREGGRVALRAARAPGNRALEITVEDGGIGIAPADCARLFKPFVQLDSALSRKYGGTGLGLALAKRIAELHGGTIEVRSEQGTGSAFTVRLPLEEREVVT